MNIKPEYKIIADHLRSSSFLIADGILPSNEGRGYVLRRIMRRAMRQAHKLGTKQPLMHQLVSSLITQMSSQYPELIRAQDLIISTLLDEEIKFRETLEKGLKILDEEIAKINSLNNKKDHPQLSGKIAFKLYDTYGFPIDLTQDICKEHHLEINLQEFNEEMDQQRIRARKNWIGSGELSEEKIFFALKEQFGETTTHFYHSTNCSAKILAIIENNQFISEINSFTQDLTTNNSARNIFIILDQTSFYATSGGQKGDDGNIIKIEDFKLNQSIDYHQLKNYLDISETKKFAGNLFAHYITECKGNFKVGDQVQTLVNNRNRQLRAQNHSATHLLHHALKQVLGNQISQKGSNVDAKQLTFDFNFNRALSNQELDQIEELVNFNIRKNSPVKTKEMDLNQAIDSGAQALFGEKYDQQVRVVGIGSSQELCGGTHVQASGNIGIFKIISENSVASGIRRITAKTGFFAIQHLKIQEQKLNALLQSLKIKQQFDELKINNNSFLSNKIGFDEISYFSAENTDQIITNEYRQNINEIIDKTLKIGDEIQLQLKTKDKEIAKLKKQIWQESLKNLTNHSINQIKFASHIFHDLQANDLREIISELKSKKDFSNQQVILFFAINQSQITACLSLSLDLTDQLDASKLIIEIVNILDGKGGGGKKDLAIANGNNPNKIDQACDYLKNYLKSISC